MNRKKIFALLLATAALLCGGAAPQVTLSNRNPRVGEVILIQLQSDEGCPEVLAYPRAEKARFLPNRRSQSIRMVNGRTTYSIAVSLQLLQPGEVKIPPFRVRTGKHTYTIPAMTLEVLSPHASAPAGGAVSSADGSGFRGELTTGGKVFYAGQEIPVECILYLPLRAEVRQLGYPQITLAQAVFSDFRKVNPENPRFQRPVQGGTARLGSRLFRTVVFRTAARIFEPGEYTFAASAQAAVAEAQEREDEDDFFSFRFFSGGRLRTVEIPCTASPFTVKPLPPLPEGAFFTGLIGPETIRFTLNGGNPAVGELLTLECRVSGGNGAWDALKAPELDLPGFRVYPPEIRRETAGDAVIHYAMIPLREGKTELKLALTVFDARKGEYRVFPFAKTLQVSPAPAGRKPVSPAPAAVQKKAAAPAGAEPLWKLRAAGGPRVRLPLWKNGTGFIGFAVTAGILLILGSLGADLLRRRRENDPAYARRKAASGARKAFLAKLRAASGTAALTEAANRELCEYLSARLGLPAGSSALEIAAQLPDPEDAELLREAGESAFRPGSSRSPEEWKTGLLRLLKHVGVLWLLVCGTGIAAEDGIAAFERGDTREAIRCFADRCRTDAPEVSALYNLGCAYAADGNEPMALLMATRALRLSPRSGDVLALLNAVRGKLLLPPEQGTETPAELLRTARDQFRPDEYAVGGAALFLLFAILFCFRRKLKKGLFSGLSLAILAMELVFLLAVTLQLHGPYSPRGGFITARKAELRTLPAEKSGRVEATLSGGTPVTVLDERERYFLVSGAGFEGWVRRPDVTLLFCREGK